MIKLFEITETYELELNKAWIMMIPEFATILKKDKGSPGDYRGDKKLMAIKKLSYIYLMYDFSSPFRELPFEERRTNIMEALGLTEKELNDGDIPPAIARYQKMLYDASPALRTLNAIKKGMAVMNKYFEEIDFDQTDKMGRLLFSPSEYNKNITEIKRSYLSLKEFEQMVEEELTNAPEVRGEVELGELEAGPNKFSDLLDAVSRNAAAAAPSAMPDFDADGDTLQAVTPPAPGPGNQNFNTGSFKNLGQALQTTLASAKEAAEDGLS